jgi:drug/metabolite transporter (DMT)-like permease
MAVLLRMLIATVIGLFIVKLRGIYIPLHKTAVKVYSYSGIGIFGGMLFSYLAASHISSGVLSLVFGLSPVISAMLARKILSENKISSTKKIAMFVCITGLTIVCSDNFTLENDAVYGLIYVLCAVFLFSLSGVLVKSVTLVIHPLATTVGALSVSTPLFLISWLLLDGTLPVEQWQAKSLWACIYLGLFGSLIGFYAYFTVLQKLSASSVTLITLVTPIIALMLGATLNNEIIHDKLIVGAFLVVFGLGIYHFGDSWIRNFYYKLKRK